MTRKSTEARVIVERAFNDAPISFESGWIAKQANGAVIVRCGDTMVLCTVCRADPRPDQDFFPMVVDYQEKFFAAGRIPGGYLKREGRPAEHEVLTSRLIDRPIRPLFPDYYMDEIQIMATVLSVDGEHSPDMLAITGCSAALHISDIPFLGPLAGVRVGRVGGKLVANPTRSEQERSDIDLVIAGTKDAIVMVEGGAQVVPEAEILDALFFGHEELQKLIQLQEDLRAKLGKPKVEFVPPARDVELSTKVKAALGSRLSAALAVVAKQDRNQTVSQLEEEIVEKFTAGASEDDLKALTRKVKDEFHKLTSETVRERVLSEGMRIDGRGLADVRHVECEVGIIPRAHGSALFTRGETQGIVTTTLGTSTDAQRIDSLFPSKDRTFMLHYNFPPYSTGEVKMLRSTGRREVGHGALAERALRQVLPTQDKFPYVVRVVSDITESNGSSSMASVCGGSLSMMDAGVPIENAVAGVAMGLIKEGSRVAVLTDILGDEDHLGDMDFKVCGTQAGVTSLQMDIKCDGLNRAIMDKALQQARDGRLHILGIMNQTISAHRAKLSQFAPTIETIKINPDKIRDVIGPGGKTIRSITESTGVKIDISDDGTVNIASANADASKRAIEIIMGLTEEAEIGKVYCGVVKRITDFGAFVEILPGVDGLLHISQLAHTRVERVSDIVKEGDEVNVRVLDIDKQGRIRLSRKEALPPQ